MRPLELAFKYMDIVFQNRNLEELNDILTKDLKFKGPLYEYHSSSAYIDSMLNDPPVGFKYATRNAFENESFACLVYDFYKPGISVPMCQTFEIKGGKICEIQLIFDTTVFAKSNENWNPNSSKN